MSEPQAQYVYRDGRWRDQWNNLHDGEPCAEPDAPWWEAIAESGWCQCGAPDAVVDALAAYLKRFTESESSGLKVSPDLDRSSVLDWMLAYRADQLGFTEHGGNIAYAWLTPGGERWLELYAQSQ